MASPRSLVTWVKLKSDRVEEETPRREVCSHPWLDSNMFCNSRAISLIIRDQMGTPAFKIKRRSRRALPGPARHRGRNCFQDRELNCFSVCEEQTAQAVKRGEKR